LAREITEQVSLWVLNHAESVVLLAFAELPAELQYGEENSLCDDEAEWRSVVAEAEAVGHEIIAPGRLGAMERTEGVSLG